jgi:hypothetical protein
MVPPKPMGIYAAYASKYNFIVPHKSWVYMQPMEVGTTLKLF